MIDRLNRIPKTLNELTALAPPPARENRGYDPYNSFRRLRWISAITLYSSGRLVAIHNIEGYEG